MDARRQKRLGPAPIASFEKSFEDNATTNAQQQQQQHQQEQKQQHQHHAAMMEQSVRKQTATTTTTNRNRTAGGIEAPSIANANATSAAAAAASCPASASASASTSSSSSSSVSSATCSATIVQAKQRPPPLKTATTTVTTTLVSSSEGGQPLPPSAGGGPGGGGGGGAGGGHAGPGASYRGAATLTTPSTPRIELSRASSSSHHEEDSRESSPENVFEQVGTGTLQETIGLGFREEGALELRSSTEELYFMDPEQKKEEQERIQQQQQQAKRSSPHIFKFDDHQSYLQQHQRKDSASSEVAALLCISGRTSRISSVGSQGSAVSRLSAVSGVSRSPSPHRMLLETSFCGPKPMELAGSIGGGGGGGTGGSNASTAASSTHSQAEAGMPGAGTVAANAALLEQLLLARKHDPTQAVLAEGIKVLPPAPGGAVAATSASTAAAAAVGNRRSRQHNGEKDPGGGSTKPSPSTLTMGAQRRSTKSPGQMVVGKTASGTEYIRINLRPDHMYSDKGIAANERVVEAPNQLAPVYSKPASLSLQGAAGGAGGGGGAAALDDQHHRLTPTASPKPGRRLNSRSPSPATGGGGGAPVSRKSSFSSLFRLGKDSPDSPRESARSRSKSKERPATASGGLGGSGGSGSAPQGGGGSQNVTPSKQKSVLAIFKPGKRGSQSSKSSSPIESTQMDAVPPPPPPAPGSAGSHNRTPAGSRPGSRLRYYDEPVEGYIHIPLHTPPDEREARSLLQGIQQLAHAAQASMDPSPLPTHRAVVQRGEGGQATTATGGTQGTQITAIQLAAAAAALRPVAQRTKVAQRPDLDAIQSLPSQEDPPGIGPGELQQIQAVQANWSLEVQRHTSSSQDSQETTADSVVSSVVSARAANLQAATATAATAAAAAAATASSSEMQRLPSVESTQSACEPRLVHTVATVNAPHPDLETADAKERRRLLFATRLGSGSQEQLFSTQFSISKTESQSSQLSEQVDHSGGSTPATTTTSMGMATASQDGLQRQGTVIRRMETSVPPPPPPRGVGICSSEEEQQQQQLEKEKEKEKPSSSQVLMRTKHKSRPSSEDEAAPPADLRHSRYLENFDVRRKLHENLTGDATSGDATAQVAVVPRKPKRQSVPESRRETPPSYSSGTVTPTTPTPMTAAAQQQVVVATRPSPTSTITPPAASSSSYRDAPTTICYTDPLTSGTPPTETVVTPTATATVTPSPTPDPMLISPPAERRHSQSTDEHEPVESSESERDSDMAASSSVTTAVPAGGDLAGGKHRHHHNFPRNVCVIEEHESTGLVSQESFDDELPYIPTTLPEERAQGVPLIPMRERANMELKTCPVDRPRSTTPLNPSHLEEYCTGIMMPQEGPATTMEMDGIGAGGGGGGGAGAVATSLGNGAALGAAGGSLAGGSAAGAAPVRGEKLRISLPRKESVGKERIQSSKSPRRVSNASGKSWFEFAEEGLRANNNLERKDSAKQLLPVVTPPAATQQHSQHSTPRTPSANLEEPKPKASTQRKLSGHWIDFENIPEKRKPAKRITTLPKDTLASSSAAAGIITAAAATTTTSSTTACGSHHRSGSGHHHHHHHHQNQNQQPQHQHQQQGKITTDGGDKLHYNYVKPEDCQCECHEAERVESGAGDTSTATGTGTETGPSTGTGSESLASVELLQHGEDMLPLLEPEATHADGRTYGDEDHMAVRHSGNNKGGVISRHDEFPRRDTGSSPRTRKFPDRK